MDSSLNPTSRAAAATDAERNALFYVPVNPFVHKQPAVPIHVFEQEREDLLSDRSTTRTIPLDLSSRMGLQFPATTPNMLARYVVVAARDSIALRLNAVVTIHYVMAGRGYSISEGDRIDWKEGDVFLFPCFAQTVHTAADEGAVLYVVTDEPVLSFGGTTIDVASVAKVAPTYFPVEEIDLNLARTYAREGHGAEAAKSVWFVCGQMAALRTTSPHITANLNTLGAGDDQRPHRHNAAALTLSIAGDGVHSVVDGQRSDWTRFSVMVTPPAALHSHHNRGSGMMRSFVVQDSGLHYHSRTAGFKFDR